MPITVRIALSANGHAEVSCASSDIGTGTYTIMTQIAAEMLGLPIENVTFRLGDSTLPDAPVEGGSFTAASVGSAVKAACDKLRKKLCRLAQKSDGSALAGGNFADATFADGKIRLNGERSPAVSITKAMRQANVDAIEEEASAEPSPKKVRYSSYAHSAIFAEVKVDADFGTVSVTRLVSAVAGGRILNPKTARSQVIGGLVGGIGVALQEESVLDRKFGRVMTHSLADYHVPVNADVHDLEVIFVAEEDKFVNPLGAKGLGEIGIVGVAAAILNAVYHATGKRVRDLPITPDKLLTSS
jgi:xanthine dehydrogenase YagR molybdenum-binding subunit